MRSSIRSVLALLLGTTLILPSSAMAQGAGFGPGQAPTAPHRFVSSAFSAVTAQGSTDPVTLEQAGQALAQQYMHLSEGEKSGIARQLYSEAEAHAENLEWESAIQKYVAAYFLVPDKHGFAYKIGMTARHVGNCQLAYDYLSVLLERGSNQAKLAEKVGEGRRVLAQIEEEGCAETKRQDPGASAAVVESNEVSEPAQPTPPLPQERPQTQQTRPRTPPPQPQQAGFEDDNPLGLAAPNNRRDRARRLNDAARQQRRGMLTTGIILSSIGALGVGAGVFFHVKTTKTARRLVELSRSSQLTKFPRWDYSCRYVAGVRDNCPVVLAKDYKQFSGATPIAYGVGGGILAVGIALIIAQRVRVAKLRKKVKLGQNAPRLELESISPVWTPQGTTGASATLRF